MPDNPTTTPKPNPDDAMKGFWDEFDKRVKGHLGTFFDEKKAELMKAGTSRTGGRTTVPSFLAGLMFGPEKKD
jgi:hypothetical protein